MIDNQESEKKKKKTEKTILSLGSGASRNRAWTENIFFRHGLYTNLSCLVVSCSPVKPRHSIVDLGLTGEYYLYYTYSKAINS